ncbi:MAG: [FeFe] hydrogenase H-cluster radical SAM maturase HydE [Terracidiphilus sp.]|jgi:biotin synthase
MTALTKPDLLEWLRESDPSRLQQLYARADAVRKEHVGDAVHLRGLIEVSSHCERQCMYCGLRQANRALPRYRMTRDEILDCARQAERLGYGTVVMQAGEDDGLTTEWIAEIVRWIKRETRLAVTLSLGERSRDEFQLWRSAGADRYLLRFETSDENLFRIIHPQRADGGTSRIALLRQLKSFGYEAGGGVMVGIPGQSYESLADDILTFRALDLDMIGIGPYIAHTATPLGSGALRPAIAPADQVPNSEETVYKMIALTRIVCPTANIPSTTALATLNKKDGRRMGLRVGANVVMPNLTPVKYRSLYEIYPAKVCIDESAADCNQCLRGQIFSLGRFAGQGPGGRGSVETLAGVLPDISSQFVQLQSQ